ncbi:MAG: exosortase K [Lachnospiraceae bacterium]
MKCKSLMKQYGIFYLIGLIIILSVKYYYRNASSDDLKWILTPTAWWVQTISQISFEYESQLGYVSHEFRFILAPSCSGVQFMLISIATLLFSFIHRMKTKRMGFNWLMISMISSYLFTIFVNGLRIILSIYLPPYLSFCDQWMTAEKLHSLIGIAVYFTSLLVGYHIAGLACKGITSRYLSDDVLIAETPEFVEDSCFRTICFECLPPIFWYLSIVLGLPSLSRLYQGNFDGFLEYTIIIVAVCLVIMFLFYFGYLLRKLWKEPT